MSIKNSVSLFFPLLDSKNSTEDKLVFSKGMANTLYFAKKKAFLVAEYIFTKTGRTDKIIIQITTDETNEVVEISLNRDDFHKLPKVNVFNIKDVVNQFYDQYKIN
ncbi:hypothetical protein AS589_09395 [Empedobacter brevis]|uniref:hypothetical protein n=1 Tax=Empedobacter brevis TaxID=247 RepID=UPI00131F55C1|nr:hypothetical protein [Empedobacter brevis]QHC84969.1 hypothetical protein AS589_09395 [Empedobacter brevis]